MRMREWSTAHAPTKKGAYLQRKRKIRSIAVEHSDSVRTASRNSRKGGDYNKPHAASICDITAHAILSNLALVRNNDSPKDELYSDRESFALASLVLYIQPFENRSVRLLVSYSKVGHHEYRTVF